MLNHYERLHSEIDIVSMEGNFSDEVVNMVYLKARNLINNDTPIPQSGTKNDNINAAMDRGLNRTKLNKIIEKIKNYKVDYSKELKTIKDSFKRGVAQRKYPSSLYIQRDSKQDFTLPGELDTSNPWNR